nr:hypothetical protein [Sporofaciens musculi]
MSKFPTYSLRNTVLIAMQAPDATHVMGFNAWKDPLINRHVKADERNTDYRPYRKDHTEAGRKT